MHMDATDRALAEHREATMPEILARNAEYEALPEVVREKAWRLFLRTQMLRVWNRADGLPDGPTKAEILAIADDAIDNTPIAFTLTFARAAA